jgi:hypothetical protein
MCNILDSNQRREIHERPRFPVGLRFSRIGLLPVPAGVLETAGFIRRSADYRSGPAEALAGPASNQCSCCINPMNTELNSANT